ncbi:MAG: hypothetical protein V7L23_31500 [Nostoc sp.]|uniref:hypothetical protein n=1 Tax=Nostoc sp. TaxID=1180 RepID=UPI002FF0C7EF
MTSNAITFIYHHEAKKTGVFQQLVIIFFFSFQNLCLEALLSRYFRHLQIVDDYGRSQTKTT